MVLLYTVDVGFVAGPTTLTPVTFWAGLLLRTKML